MMPHVDVCGGVVYTPFEKLEGANICVEGGRIAAITDGPCGRGSALDASGRTVIPGLIDIHTHGAFGWDASSGPPDEAILIQLARRGTTALLPTIYPIGSRQHRISVLQSYGEFFKRQRAGASALGIHLEGPFLNPELGAQLPDWCECPRDDGFAAYLSESGEIIRMMTLSPELPGSDALVKALAERGIVAAVGHSAADSDDLERAQRAGLKHGTHIFNATRRPIPRFRGCGSSDMNEFCLAQEDMSVDIMVDGQKIHLDDILLRLAWRCKGPDKLIAISDSTLVAGLPPGSYDSGDGRKMVTDNSDVCRFEDGDICGSTMMVLTAVRNLAARLNLPWEQALPAATSNPARLLGIEKAKGAIAPGMDADLVVLDQSWDVHLSMVAGSIV